jgi:hypothetical protein
MVLLRVLATRIRISGIDPVEDGLDQPTNCGHVAIERPDLQ